MIAKTEGLRGNMPTYRERLGQGRCWVGWSIGLGFVFIIIYVSIKAIQAAEEEIYFSLQFELQKRR
mgnify:FL=1